MFLCDGDVRGHNDDTSHSATSQPTRLDFFNLARHTDPRTPALVAQIPNLH